MLIKIVENIINIENHYEIPIDIEFGVEKEELYILQARPITTYNKIPIELLTDPNEKRQLYFDTTIAVQGFDKPLSTLGGSVLGLFIHYIGKNVTGAQKFDNIRDGATGVVGGKFLINCSNVGTRLPLEKAAPVLKNINNQLPELLLKYGKSYTNEKVPLG